MSASWEPDVCVVGAGAAGLWAAAVAARRGARVLLLEKTPRTGTKVLASGGTRCNLTTTLSAAEAARLFRRGGERFLGPAFRALPPAAVRERFAALGVPTVEAPLDKVFPESGRARDVRDALEREVRAAGVDLVLEAAVLGVRRREGAWEVDVAGGRLARARRLLLCPGGESYPRTGTTGDGYRWLAGLGLPLVPPVPALVPLASSAEWVRELTGIACQDADVRLVEDGGRTVARRRRPLLFTHSGVSGPAAMDVSVHVARAPEASWELRVDLAPELDRESLRGELVRAAGARGAPRVGRVLPALPRRLRSAVARAAELTEDDPPAARLGKAQRHRLVEALKGLAIPVEGTLGFDRAEVTSGGLDLRAVDPRTMEVNGWPGLHVFGELLDLDGPIGGLNFQAAFACAELAGRAVGGKLSPD